MIIALSVAVLGVVVAAWTPLRRRGMVLAVCTSMVVIGFMALLVAGSRWMIVPLGIAVALTAVTVALRATGDVTSRHPMIAKTALAGVTSVSAAVSAVVAGGAAWALPTLELPPVSGDFGVGTSRLQWDTEAPESLTADPTDTRVLVAPSGSTGSWRSSSQGTLRGERPADGCCIRCP